MNQIPTLYRLHYYELLESFTDYTHILLMDPKILTRRQFFTAELEAIMSVLRIIRITVKNNKFVVFW